MNKKVYAILGGIVLLILIVVSFIVFLESKKNPSAATATPITTNTQLTPTPSEMATATSTPSPTPSPSPTASSSPITKITDGPAVAPAFSYDSQALWYFTPDGHLFKINLQTELKQEYPLPSNSQVDSVIWPLTGNDFITVALNADGTHTFSYYSSANKTFTKYPSNVTSVDFLPDGAHVAYEWVDAKTGKGELQVAAANLTGYSNVVALPDADDVIKVSPLGSKVLAYSQGSPSNGKLYLVTLDTKQVYTLYTAATNQAIWAPSGQNFIWNKDVNATTTSTSTDEFYGDLTSEKDTDMNIQTPVAKMAFDSTGANLYYAVAAADGSGDSLWKMNLQTFMPTEILTSAQVWHAA